jgi:hypothetical protein
MKKICKCCGNDPDEVVQSVVNKFRQRSAQGIKSYGMTMADNPAPLDKWIEDIQEELMDAILYIERLKQEVI